MTGQSEQERDVSRARTRDGEGREVNGTNLHGRRQGVWGPEVSAESLDERDPGWVAVGPVVHDVGERKQRAGEGLVWRDGCG